ncbi:uncharacterized protein LOC135214958 [Macrobrachium nipponense]|uniref:uncharacterized protein LOC135214958 n=1 Tax=Macrobrachium nipponense TaxID=159736 RepID=UPI0030C86D98
MANLQQRLSSLRFSFVFFVSFFIAVIIIAHAEAVRADGHHDKSDREKDTPMASASHLDRSSQRLHHRRSALSSHHRGRAARKGRRSSAIHHKKTSPRRSRNSYANPLWESLLRHALHQSSKGGTNLFFDPYRSPAISSFHKYYRDQVNLMEKLRSQLVNRVGHLRGRMNYYQHGSRHAQPSRSSSHHTRGHRRHPYHRSHQEVTGHNGGKRQYKIVRNNVVPVKDVPEDVEVFGRPTVVRTHVRPTRPSFTPSVWTTSVPGTDPKNCTKTDREPFHHTEIKSTSISHSRNNFSPVHSVISSHTVFSGGKYHGSEEKGPLSVGEVLGAGFPAYSNVFSHPVTRIHDSSMLPSGAIIPAVKNHLGSVRVSIGSTGRSQKPSIEEHLNKLPSTKGDRRGEELPCIKCPPDTRVEAPRGSDCVIAYPPSPLSCTPRFIPELRTVVTEGPAPGSLLPEGRYRMIIAVWTSDSSTSTPVTTCNVSYDVEVRKCPSLPEVEGGEVTCTAGRAWGSKCSWVCRGGRLLQGSSVTTCTGHSRPRWTHQPPRCNEPTSEKPEIPPPPSTPLHPARPPSPPIGSCPQPPDVPGGRLICEPPSIEILPRRDLIPKDEPAPSVAEDDAPLDGVIRPRSVSSSLELYPVGTSCKVECDPGLVLRQSEMDRVFLTCSPALTWNKSPSGCYSTEPPVPRDNDCDDVTLSLDQISSLPLPVFFNVNGDRAEVTCDMQEIKRGQHFVRKCKATDQDLQTSATCQYVITVRPTVEIPSEKPDEGAAGGSAKNPKNTEYETVADVFRTKGKKHKTNGDRKRKPDKISFVPQHQKGDLSEEDLTYHYDVFGQGDADYTKPGDRSGDDRASHEIRPESVLHPTERVPQGIAEEQIREEGGLATSMSPVVSRASVTLGEGSKRRFHSHAALVPKANSVPGMSGESSKITGEREVIPQVSKPKRGRERAEGEHPFDVTRREKADETETAVMEAAIELNILVDDCRNADQVKKALYELLLMLESCKKLACHTPKTKCRQRPGQEESVVKVTWIVGGLFEPLEDYYYDDVQVPVVETDIDSLMISAERLIASERTTRAMEVLGAAIDLTSFSLNRLDLVCKNKAYRFDAQTNRCIQDELQEL